MQTCTRMAPPPSPTHNCWIPLSLMVLPPRHCDTCPVPVNHFLAVPSPLTAMPTPATHTPGAKHQLRRTPAGGSMEWGPEDPMGSWDRDSHLRLWGSDI